MSNLIKSSLDKLYFHQIPNPHLDLRILLNYSSKTNKEIFLSNFKQTDIDIKKFNKFLERRLNFEPISKILNKKNFWKYEFFVNNFVIDPRPESELIIEEAIKLFDLKKNIRILDIGTGSGCLSVSLAKEFINSKIIANDISVKAIHVAKKNFKIHQCEQIKTKLCSIDKIKDRFDLIVSNPPYIANNEYLKLSKDIQKFEPKIAFLAGNDGLFFYKKFAKILPNLMKSKGFLVLEIGQKQALECKKLFIKSGLKFVKKVKDLQKKDRILIFSNL